MSFPWAKHYEPKVPFMRYLDEKLPLPRLVQFLRFRARVSPPKSADKARQWQPVQAPRNPQRRPTGKAFAVVTSSRSPRFRRPASARSPRSFR